MVHSGQWRSIASLPVTGTAEVSGQADDCLCGGIEARRLATRRHGSGGHLTSTPRKGEPADGQRRGRSL